MEAISQAGYEGKCKIGLDVAASEFKVKGEDAYDLDFKYDGDIVSGEALGDLYQSLAADFPIVTIEDPFDEVCIYHVFVHGFQTYPMPIHNTFSRIHNVDLPLVFTPG
jgi:enolase